MSEKVKTPEETLNKKFDELVPLDDRMKTSEKMVKARCRLMTKEPWYGTFAIAMIWRASEMEGCPCKTMGVRIMGGGNIECIYYPPFVASLNIEQLYGVIMHEIEHVVRLHCIRIDRHQHPRTWNIAADMAVNGKKNSPRIGYKQDGKMLLPFEDMVFVPEETGWNENDTTEEFYKKLVKDAKNHLRSTINKCPKCGKDVTQKPKKESSEDKQGEKKEDESGPSKMDAGKCKCPHCGHEFDKSDNLTDYGRLIDSHETWNESDTAPDEARQVVKNICDQATQKNRGNYPGHLKQAIEALNKPIISWQQILRNLLGTYCGKRRLTYSRRNRRNDEFGIKGISHHAAAKVLVITDTSGSVSDEKIKQFFTEIEAVSHQAELSLLQWDHNFQGFTPKYQRGDWKKIHCNGRGGTDMAAPVMWAVENKAVNSLVILLTDGECNWPEEHSFPIIFLVANNTEPEHKPKWGHYVFVKYDK